MIRTVIVEDEPNALKSLLLGIEKYVPLIKIAGHSSDVTSAKILIEEENPELVLLDIKLREKDAFQLLDQLDEISFEIIFITAYGEFKEKAFDYFALHYLQKPVDFERLKVILEAYIKRKERAFTSEKYTFLRRLFSSNFKNISIPSKNGYDMVEIKTIILCTAEGNYTRIFMDNNKVLLSSKSLKHYDDMFEGIGFYRIHRSQLINLHYVHYIKDDTVVLKNGMHVVVSKRNKRGLIQLLRDLG